MADLISDDLRAELGIVFLRGFLDYSAGKPVEDDDDIPGGIGLPLIQMAKSAIDKAEPILAELSRQNPQLMYETVYAAGGDIAKTIEALGPQPIYLN